MDPVTLELLKVVGPTGAFAVMMWYLHREALRAFREELTLERNRNDKNLERLYDKFDKIAAVAICRYTGHFQVNQRRPPEAPG